jgi:hypothetical protein
MKKLTYNFTNKHGNNQDLKNFEKIPVEVRKWVISIPLTERLHILSILCYLMFPDSKDTQLQLLDDYAADGLISRIVKDQIPQQLVKKYLNKFKIDKQLNDLVLRSYIKQFYIHSTQDLRTQPYLYLESVLRLFHSIEERNKLFYYILGFEILKMIFQMSWLQQERLYQLQKNQEHFLKTYIKPIQNAHRINKIIVPKDENVFFAKRDFFIKNPKIKKHKLIELVRDTFPVNTVSDLGFLIIHHIDFLVFDYEYIFNSEQDSFFI